MIIRGGFHLYNRWGERNDSEITWKGGEKKKCSCFYQISTKRTKHSMLLGIEKRDTTASQKKGGEGLPIKSDLF